MKYGRIVNVAVLLALAFGTVAFGAGQAAASERSVRTSASGTPIVLGSVGTYSATTGNFTNAGKPAIEAWADWVNAHGGINGHPVKLIVKDNMNDEAQAVSEVQQLVQQDHVVVFVSNQDGSLNWDMPPTCSSSRSRFSAAACTPWNPGTPIPCSSRRA